MALDFKIRSPQAKARWSFSDTDSDNGKGVSKGFRKNEKPDASYRKKVMGRLVEHIIHGVDHNSPDRYPPPRCHPGTRIQINDYIFTWFYDEKKKEMLIWICGPAGVGKSTIMQTLAEKFSASRHLGASVFISRDNERNASRLLFLTIAYQLAARIEDYCTFLVNKLGQVPELVNKGMEEQFKMLIVEPFVDKKIGADDSPWGILLDGLDELDEHRFRREVIRLIGKFILIHPKAPLVWVIASRPEAHIWDTFEDKKLAPAHRRQYISANSKESREDVGCFLSASLKRIRGEFIRQVPKEWPSKEELSHLASAASGLFAFADAAIRFIEDPQTANPSTCLRQVLSSLNGLTVTTHDRPFVSLDAMYTSILSSIPSDVWLTTKRVLGALLYAQGEDRRALRMLSSIAFIVRLDMDTVYNSIRSCHSLLDVSDIKEISRKPITFYHASFSHYLMDSTRSQNFHISSEIAEEEVRWSLAGFWLEYDLQHASELDFGYVMTGREKREELDVEASMVDIFPIPFPYDVNVVSDNQPFSHLDIPFTYVLNLVPPKAWPRLKRVLSAVLYSQSNHQFHELLSLKGISVVLGLELSTISGLLSGCSSILKIPPPAYVQTEPIFFRASFGEYLADFARSGRFHISLENAEEEVLESLSKIWWNFQSQYPPGLDSEYNTRWDKYCERYNFDPHSLDMKPVLLYHIHDTLFTLLVEKHGSKNRFFDSDQEQDRCFNILGRLDSATLCQGLRWQGTKCTEFLDWVFNVWMAYHKELTDRGIICEATLEQIHFEHLDWPILYPSYTYVIRDVLKLKNGAYDSMGPREKHISDLKVLQQRNPQLLVLICGQPGKRFVLFKDTNPPPGVHIEYNAITFYTDFVRYHLIPYADPQNPVESSGVDFKTFRKRFPRLAMTGRHNGPEFQTLARAMSSCDVFATMVIRFIEDPHHSSPAARLDQVLSIIDATDAIRSSNQPNLYLDALYTHILSSIPAGDWPTTKRVLGAILCAQTPILKNGTITTANISAILDIELDVIYNSLKNCSSILGLPGQCGIDDNQIVLHHNSFADYLQEPSRSQRFYLSSEEARANVLSSIVRIWKNFMRQPPSMRDCYTWTQHFGDKSKSASHEYIPDAILALLMEGYDPGKLRGPFEAQEYQDRCFELLAQLDAETVCEGFGVAHIQRFFSWLVDIRKVFRKELKDTGTIREVQLAQLQFNHLHAGSYLSHCICTRSFGEVMYKKVYSSRMLSSLGSFQKGSPHLLVLICGPPGKRFACFEYQYTEADLEWLVCEEDHPRPGDTGIYTIPYDP